METQPYSLQSPEQIAKDYGGNKQKIAEAMQMGIVDPTAGTLAGMFIDRMRSAQIQEQAPQQTVAQQVFNPQAPMPPAPPQGGPPPMPPQGGLPPMPPQGAPQGAPQEMVDVPMPSDEAMPEMAAGGMVPPYASGGGLSDVPIPDGMFDEPSNGGFNDGYAGGGLVAFANGGDTGRYGSFFERIAAETIPGIRVTSRKRTPQENALAGGVANSYHQTDDARDFAPPEGMSMKELAAALRGKFGSNFDVIDEGDHVHVEPGPKANARPVAPKRGGAGDTGSFETKMPAIMDLAAQYRQSFADNASPETKRREELIRGIEESLDPEARKKQQDQDKWAALAQLGFGLAGSQTPNLLQAFGETASQVLPNIMKQRAADKAAQREDLKALAELETKSNEEKRQIEALAMEMAKAEAGLLSDERKMDLQYRIANLDDSTKRMIAATSNQLQITLQNMQQTGAERLEGKRGSNALKIAQAKAAAGGDGILGTGGDSGDNISFLDL
jgi:hypothetical protein